MFFSQIVINNSGRTGDYLQEKVLDECKRDIILYRNYVLPDKNYLNKLPAEKR